MQMNYIEMNQQFQKYKKLIVTLNQWITYVFYMLYPLDLLYLFLNRKELLVRSILVPGCSFILLSFIRKKIARKRPYEVYAFKPVRINFTCIVQQVSLCAGAFGDFSQSIGIRAAL